MSSNACYLLARQYKSKRVCSPDPPRPSPFATGATALQTRTEIVAAAERHFAERGFEATRLDDIATEVGIRRAAIFYYFKDKQELYAAVLDEVFGDWTAALPSGAAPAERLEVVAHRLDRPHRADGPASRA